MKTDLEKITEDRDIWIDNYKKLQAGYNTLDKKCRDQAALINQSVKVHQMASDKIEHLEVKIRRVAEAVQNAQREHEDIVKQVGELSTEAQAVSKQNEVLLGQRDEACAVRDEALRRLEKITEERDGLLLRVIEEAQGMEMWRKKAQEVEAERDRLLAKVENQNTELVCMESENVTLKQELAALSAERDALKLFAKRANEERSALKDKVADLERQLMTQRAERANLQGYLEVLEPANKTLEGHLSARDSEIKNLREDMKLLQELSDAEKDQLKQQVGNYAQTLGERTEECECYKKEILELRDYIKRH